MKGDPGSICGPGPEGRFFSCQVLQDVSKCQHVVGCSTMYRCLSGHRTIRIPGADDIEAWIKNGARPRAV